MTKFLNISTDTTLGGASPSDSTVSSQKAVKTYVDGKTLDSLSNVTISSPTAGQNLTYDATNQVWKNTSTSATVAWGGVTGNIADQTDLQNALDGKQGLLGGGTSGTVLTNSGTAGTVNATTLATVATSGSYTDLTNKPTIPTVNNATLTITQGGVSKGTFTANASSDTTIALDAGTTYTAGDGIDITSNVITATGTKNKNTAAGATNPVYDWVGTLAEYTAQAVATNHPDWICLITDDCEATAYQAYTQSQCNNLFVQKGHEVIAFQAPTAQNNYTWYRKYADGWVEQGGYSASTGSWGTTTINLPVQMRDVYYTLTIGGDGASADFTNNATATVRGGSRSSVTARTTTNFQCQSNNIVTWQVSGMAA